jgi:RNA-directed DNA polymerase
MDRRVLGKWLKAGFLEKHAWFATTEGTPQGGIVSPALANWTLDGLQRLLAEHFARTPRQQRTNKVHLVRYADDCAPRRCERTTSGVSWNAMLRER